MIMKWTNSYLKAQFMTSIKWGAINSEVNSKVYIDLYQELRFNNWSCFIITRTIINIYIIKKHDPIHLTIQIFILFLMHMEKKANIEGIPINILHVEYSKMTRKERTTYLIHLTKVLLYNHICFWTKLVIVSKNPKIK